LARYQPHIHNIHYITPLYHSIALAQYLDSSALLPERFMLTTPTPNHKSLASHLRPTICDCVLNYVVKDSMCVSTAANVWPQIAGHVARDSWPAICRQPFAACHLWSDICTHMKSQMSGHTRTEPEMSGHTRTDGNVWPCAHIAVRINELHQTGGKLAQVITFWTRQYKLAAKRWVAESDARWRALV